MRVCGIELIKNEAVIAVMELKNGLYDVPAVRRNKFLLVDPINTAPLKKFQFEVSQFLKDYKVDTVVIKQRTLQGKFAGGALTFKMEAALQLIPNINILVVSLTYLKEGLSKAQNKPNAVALGFKKFQEPAMLAAFGYLEHKLSK
ncbi:MAG: DUF3010 family protein [Psychromonas sp.]|nr:DUF3010 family protein [Psychromonas sp.]